MTSRTPTLELRDLTRRFTTFELGPVSLDLEPGEVYGLLGANGAGKTTLMDLIALQLRPSGGCLRHDGATIAWAETAWKTRFSYVREVPAFYDELTVGQTLRLAGRLYERWDAALSARLVDRLGLRPDQPVAHLSRGTRVKLGLASALAARVALLILDEPTAGLDPSARAELHATLAALVAEHPSLCVILSSHLFDDIETSATQICMLRRGQMVLRTRVEAVSDARVFRTASEGRLPPYQHAITAWRHRRIDWAVVEAGSAADLALRDTTGVIEEHPSSILATIYHGLEHADGD